MPQERFWLDGDLIHTLSTFSVTGHDIEMTDDEINVTLSIDLDPIHTAKLLNERQEYLAATRDDPSVEAVVEQLVSEVETALDIEYNTVGHKHASSGEYRRINDRQWESVDNASAYDDYSGLLFELTGRDINFDEYTPSIPGLHEPFLEAIADSPDHELPPPGAVRTILSEHIDNLREENQSRRAVSTLKRELEREGVNPRSAARVAGNMDELLIPDSELSKDDRVS